MTTFITTYHGSDDDGTFIRVNSTHDGAWKEALKDVEETLTDYVDYGPDIRPAIDLIPRVGFEQSILRIINPNNGHEYEAYVIIETKVGE